MEQTEQEPKQGRGRKAGFKNPNAGRKPKIGAVRCQFRLKKEAIEMLRELKQQMKISPTQITEQAIIKFYEERKKSRLLKN